MSNQPSKLTPANQEQVARAERFHRLHETPTPLRLVNAWDRFSARVFSLAGAPAIGTSSFAVALAHGYWDGQQISWTVAREVVAEIVNAAGDLPVTADIESGRGHTPSEVATTVDDVISVGAVGVNIEDSLPGSPGELFAPETQCDRLRAARAAAERRSLPLFINARCDVYFGAQVADAERPRQLLGRAGAYAESGASGLFVPGLTDLDLLATLCESVDVPVSVMMLPGLPSIGALTTVGVRRISQGGASFVLAAGFLERTTKAFLEGSLETVGGDVEPAGHLIPDLVTRP
jgi:2-methylisocitrate lyase-like PEP mutase family enzyme